MENFYYKFDKSSLNNLLNFLDRVDYKGLNEVKALNQIINILENPIDDKAKNKKENENKTE